MEARENKFLPILHQVNFCSSVSGHSRFIFRNFFPTERDNLKRNEIKKLSNETQACFWKSHAWIVCNDTKTSAF